MTKIIMRLHARYWRIIQFKYFSMNTGIYYDLNREENTEKIISHTNTARRKAKEQVEGICAYTEELQQAEQRRADVLHSFQSALEKHEFQLYFQPKISGKEAEITSAEVLVRWQRSDGEIWAPRQIHSGAGRMRKSRTAGFLCI